MALKRLMMAALGALGLSALVAGPALGQGQIPAPDAYGEITGCVTNALNPVSRPFGKGDYEKKSVLDTIFTGFKITPIDPTGMNSRQSLTGNLDPCDKSANSNTISAGFDKARSLYLNTAATVEGTDAHTEASANQAAFGGEVYDVVYSEAAARRAVMRAVDAWNELTKARDAQSTVGSGGDFTEAKALRDAVAINAFDDSASVLDDAVDTNDDQADAVREYGANMVRGFRAVAGYDSDATSADITTTVALSGTQFDADGNLLFEQNIIQDASSAAGSQTFTNLGHISTHLAQWEAAVTAAQDTLDDTEPTSDQYAVRKLRLDRLTVIRDHVQDELDRLTDVARVHASTSNQDAISDFASAITTLNEAEARVRSTASALEGASNRVKAALEDPESYLKQLVRLRQYQKDMADEAVAEAGDDPATSLTKAAENAAKALAKATQQRDAFLALQGETENPASVLLNALLEPQTGADGKPNPADDDGQALVNAIATTYDVAKGAADEAQRVVDELTGEGGQVAMNEAAIAENADNITALDGRVTQNEEDIASNTTMIGENRGMIMANTAGIAENRGMIMTNTENIATNASEIMRVEGRVDSNWDAIAMNQTAIETNSGRLDAHQTAIEEGARLIAANATSIGENRSSIMRNSDMIGELSDDLDVVRAGVAASMALAGMPAINGRGVSIGVGSFDGESAFAVGFQIQGEMASFKVGVTSASGATGASAGVGFQF